MLLTEKLSNKFFSMHTYYWIILSAFVLFFLWDLFLDLLNIRTLSKNKSEIPQSFADILDETQYSKINSYSSEKLILGLFQKTFHSIVLLVFIFLGLINLYNSLIFSLNLNYYLNGIAYLYLIAFASNILEIPFDLYGVFKIEKKYNFNTMKLRLWLVDFIKSQLISIIIFSILIFIAFVIMRCIYSWWIWVWLALFIFSIFILYVSPYIIEPLFNKYSPVEDENLIRELREVLGKTGIKLKKVQKVDASKRTKHTNAYFSGIGKVKRIVLYDTLIEKLNTKEIVAVLAHEAGHWKKKHIFKRIVLIESILLIVCNLAWQIINSDFVIRVFAVRTGGAFNTVETYLPCIILLVYFLFSLVFYPLSPLMNYMSRADEMEADVFACNLIGSSADLASALRKLAKDNLSNLRPNKLYSLFHYSHPPIVERLDYLEKLKS